MEKIQEIIFKQFSVNYYSPKARRKTKKLFYTIFDYNFRITIEYFAIQKYYFDYENQITSNLFDFVPLSH